MIELKLDDGLIIVTDQEIKSPVIVNFLNSQGFKSESATLYKIPGEVSAGKIEIIILFLKEFFPNLILQQEVQNQLKSREQYRENVKNLRNKALEIKSQIFSKNGRNFTTTVPRLQNNKKLYWYQAIGVEHASAIGNSANFSVPGSGKTWMAYSVFFKLKDEQKIVDKLLVIGPKVAFRAWDREYVNMTGKTPSIINITGNRSQRDDIFSNRLVLDDKEIFFINYSMLSREQRRIQALLSQQRFLVIADESHHFKNFETQTAEAMETISENCERKMILTGTMMPKNVHDVWTQFNFLLFNSGVLPDYDTFKKTYPKDSQASIIDVANILNPFFYRVNKPTLELPEQTFNPPVIVQMHDTQRRIYRQVAGKIKEITNQYREDAFALREWKRKAFVFLIEAATDPSLLPSTNQFTSNSSLTPKSITDTKHLRLDELLEKYESIEEENPPKKLVKAIELAKETLSKKGKVVIWCSFIKTIKKLESLFAQEGIKTRIVYGAVPADEADDPTDNRSVRIDEFSDNDDINVLIANPATLAESVSLHNVCHHAIYVDRTFNGGHYLQSLERIHRVGLDINTVTKYDVIQSQVEEGVPSIDQYIAESLERKKRGMENFLDSADLGVKRYREDENNTADYENAVGEDSEADEDFKLMEDHIDRDLS